MVLCYSVDNYIAVIFLGIPKSSKSSVSFDESAVPSRFGGRGTLYRSRDTYVDAEFDGEFIADVYFYFEKVLMTKTWKMKIISRKYFPDELSR